LRGYATTGLFGAYGPLLADDEEVARLLLREACRRAADAGLGSLRLKPLGEAAAPAGFSSLDHWVVATLPLWPSQAEAWRGIRGKQRNCVRKAREHGLQVRAGAGEIAGFYDALAHNMHHKGAPIYGLRLMRELLSAFGPRADVIALHHGGRCVSGALTLTFKGVVAVPFASSRPDALWARPNDLLYWEIISRSCAAGLRALDMGTSLRGSSALDFKLHWGAQTAPRSVLVRTLRGKPPAMDVKSPSVRALVALWRRLPRAWADALGPQVCRRWLA